MRKTTARLVLSLLTLAIVGYAAWCGRIFYLTPKLVFPSNMPERYQQMTLDWHQASDLPRPHPWSWQRFSAELWYPFREPARPQHRVASLGSGDSLVFACDHDGVTYGIEGDTEGDPRAETIIRTTNHGLEKEVIRH